MMAIPKLVKPAPSKVCLGCSLAHLNHYLPGYMMLMMMARSHATATPGKTQGNTGKQPVSNEDGRYESDSMPFQPPKQIALLF